MLDSQEYQAVRIKSVMLTQHDINIYIASSRSSNHFHDQHAR